MNANRIISVDGIDHKLTKNQPGSMGRDIFPIDQINASLQMKSLPSPYQSQHQGEERDSPGKDHKQPVGRRFFLALLSLLGTFFCSLRGWEHLYNERRIIGAAWLSGAVLLGLFGMSLWWATGFRSTWGWIV